MIDFINFCYQTFYDVPRFVSDIIVPGTNIVCEFDAMKGYEGLIVLRGRKGCVVLSAWPIGEGEIYNSGVTAYRNRTPNGKAVAVIEGFPIPYTTKAPELVPRGLIFSGLVVEARAKLTSIGWVTCQLAKTRCRYHADGVSAQSTLPILCRLIYWIPCSYRAPTLNILSRQQ